MNDFPGTDVKASAMKDNPEKLMLFLFPMITFGLFLVAVVGWWLINNYLH